MSSLLLRLCTALVYGGALIYTFFYLPSVNFKLLLLVMLALILTLEYPKIAQRDGRWWYLVPVYPLLPMLCLIALNDSVTSRGLLIYLFVLMSLFDTGAYLVGRQWGRTKLSRWSPQKTWEGVWGGVLFAGGGLWLLRPYLYTGTTSTAQSVVVTNDWLSQLASAEFADIFLFIIFTLSVSALAVTGDLFESWLKRQAGLKDTSALLPGHGGLLDRLDSVLFGAYFFYLFRGILTRWLL